MRDSKELIEQIKSSLDIADIIGRKVSLRPAGRGFVGLCPFHADNTPSFHVYTDTQSYYCFSCHEAGDIFSFVMKSEGLSFPEAIDELADEAGIDTGTYGHENSRASRGVHDVLAMSQEYFTACLKSSPGANAWLERRHLTPEDASRFGLGYAPASWDGLTEHLRKSGVNDRLMIESGLCVLGKNGVYDRFRGRVMFPVKDIAGRIVAFGGRIIDGEGAKYINSPESEIYHKRSSLYMLNIAGRYIREKSCSILCEGYMDALRLHKCGFPESVASLGTSLTSEQAGLLKRFADACFICYDSDNAGKSAAIRGMYVLARNDLDVYVVELPSGKDPDEYLCANPPGMFSDALKNARPLLLYHLEYLRPMLEDRLRRKSALRELWDGVKSLKPDDVMPYLNALCGVFMLPESEMTRRILSDAVGDVPDVEAVPERSTATGHAKVPGELEAAFCALLMKYPECRLDVKPAELPRYLPEGLAMDCATSLLNGNPESVSALWLALGETEKTGLIARGNIFLSQFTDMKGRDRWHLVKSGLERQMIQSRLEALRERMSVATEEEMRELKELQQRLFDLQNW
ncbi:MAG: DNA primase [Synergistaceae bacterium]|nr:DNA primase [Synergistaceae bacterium]